jgi:hypothetical protein
MNAHQRSILFVLEQADAQPVPRRVELYRWASSVCGDAQVAANLNVLANSMDATEQLCREFEFCYANTKAKKGQ